MVTCTFWIANHHSLIADHMGVERKGSELQMFTLAILLASAS